MENTPKEDRTVKKSASELWAIWISAVGGAVFAAALIWYVFSVEFGFGSKLDPDLVAKAGDFIGGIVGSLWALAGLLLVYAALQAQRKDFKINLESLNNQIEEYKEHKVVLQEQSLTLKTQRFESSFYQLLNHRSETLNSLSVKFYSNRPATEGYKVLEALVNRIEKKFDRYELPDGYTISFREGLLEPNLHFPANEADALNYLISILESVVPRYESLFIHYYALTHQAILLTGRAEDHRDRRFYLETILNLMSPRVFLLFVYLAFYKRNEFKDSLSILRNHGLLYKERVVHLEKFEYLGEIFEGFIEGLSYKGD